MNEAHRAGCYRVLVADTSDRGGIATYSAALVAALRHRGTDARLAAPAPLNDGSPPLAHHLWGEETAGWSKGKLYARRGAEVPAAARGLLRAVRSVAPQVVHLQTEVVPRLDPLLLRAIHRHAAVVITAHDPVPHEGGVRDLTRQARRWRVADAVIVHGEGPRPLVAASAPRTQVRVVPVDLALGNAPIVSETVRSSLGIGSGPVVALLGIVRNYKGVRLLADAWPGVTNEIPGARLFVVGSVTESVDGLDELCSRPGVTLHEGFADDATFDRWASAADVVVLPYHHGSHSGVLHRALAQKTPVLASPTLGDEVARLSAGRIVPLLADAWAEAIVTALSDGLAAPSARVAGEATASGTLAVYDEVLAARTHRDPSESANGGLRTMKRQAAAVGALTVCAVGGHLVYPALLFALSRRRSSEPPPDPVPFPPISVVIPAYREAGVIEAKITDLNAHDYPGEIEIVVVADGDPLTAEAARQAGARTLEDRRRLGKAQALNRGVEAASNAIVVLTDANNRLVPGSLRNLVRWLERPDIGAVAGEKTEDDSGGEALYWRFESWLKQREAALGTTIAVVGELVAVRRDAWQPIPPEIGTDDLWIGVDLAGRGWKIAYEPDAIAIDPAAPTLSASWERRTRSVAGGLNVLRRRRWQLGPAGGLPAFEIWGHRLWRWTLGPAAHLTLVGWALVGARRNPLARLFLAGHAVALAAMAAPLRDRAPAPVRAGAQVLFLQGVAIGGWVRYAKGERGVIWRKEVR